MKFSPDSPAASPVEGRKQARRDHGTESQSASAFSRSRLTKSCTGRDPFERPAMPMDSAAPAYHWSAVKMTRRLRFLAARDRVVGFLAPAGFVLVFFDIFAPATTYPYHAS